MTAMDYEITDMRLDRLPEYAALYVSVFNSEPWNDSWTDETAAERIEYMMKTGTFIGKALYRENDLKGFIFGQKERSYDGMHFQIVEFCVRTAEQKKGYGKALLKALEAALTEAGIVNIYLLTSKGERTEGYYRHNGFFTAEGMILMKNNTFML